MNWTKARASVVALALLALVWAPMAHAWEFEMTGALTWVYEARGQMGQNGFFGMNDQAAVDGISGGAAGRYAPYNFYVGGYYLADTVTNGTTINLAGAPSGGRGNGNEIVSGSDAGWNTMYMATNMILRLNPAVKVEGKYYIGSWLQPGNINSTGWLAAPEYLNSSGSGSQRSFSPGYWELLWATAETPFGDVLVGKRPESWGMGLAFDGADNRTEESFAIVAPYGPFKFQLSFYPSRRGYFTDNYGNNSGYYNENPDKNNTRSFDLFVPRMVYSQGPISAGAYFETMFRHRGGEARIEDPTTRVQTPTRDYSQWASGAYLKYNNGKFFLNAEFNTLQAIDRLSGYFQPTDQIAPTYYEHYGWAVEGGVLAGPAKVSLIGAWFTGDDYRYSNTYNGIRLVQNRAGKQPDHWSNTSVFRPYSYLMVYSYGLGTSFAKDTANGFVQDASVYAGRLDYAIAANLNVYGSLFYADRYSKSGNLWGCLRPAVATTVGGAGYTPGGQVLYRNQDSLVVGGGMVPTIAETALGWELNAGMDWKLLEGVIAHCTFAFWNPGKWWSYAMVDKNVTNWAAFNTANQGNNWLTRPDKTIDAVWGTEIKLEYAF